MSDHYTTNCTCCLKQSTVYQHQDIQQHVPRCVNRGSEPFALRSTRRTCQYLLYTIPVARSHVFRQQRYSCPNATQPVKRFLPVLFIAAHGIPLLQYFLPLALALSQLYPPLISALESLYTWTLLAFLGLSFPLDFMFNGGLSLSSFRVVSPAARPTPWPEYAISTCCLSSWQYGKLQEPVTVTSC